MIIIKLRKLFRHFLAIRGHSFVIFLLMAVIFCVAGVVPHGLAWTLRACGFLLLGLFVWRAIEDLPRVTDWLADNPVGRYHKLCAWARSHQRGVLRFEVLLALAIFIPAAAHFGQNAAAMAGAPLRVDEIGSVRAYSARGPFVASATYNLAKNHIFFSVLNSLTPGSSSLHPVRARFWSFAAVTLAILLLAAFFWKLGSPLAGAVAFAIPALNSEHLTKVLEARGYGLLALLALIGLIATYLYVRNGKTWSLWVLGISVTLGAWTLPFYIVFGGGLMLLLFLMCPTRRTFLAGACTLLAIIALYSLVIASVFQVAAEYDEKYGEIFTSLDSVYEAMTLAIPTPLLRMNDFSLLVVGMIILGLPLILPRSRPETTKSLHLATLLIVGFYFFCLVLASPPIRITAFLAMPVAFVVGLISFQILTYPGLIIFRPLLGIILAGIFVLSGKSALANFEFLPDQRWEHAAKAIRIMFPQGAVVVSPNYGKFLSAYLGREFEITKEMPTDADLLSDRVILFDPTHKTDHKVIAVAGLYPTVDFAEVRFPLRKGLEQVLYIPQSAPLRTPHVVVGAKRMALPANLSEQETLLLESPEPWPIFTANFVFDPSSSADTPDILPADSSLRYRSTKIANLVVITFDEPFPESAIKLKILPHPLDNKPTLQSVWITPVNK